VLNPLYPSDCPAVNGGGTYVMLCSPRVGRPVSGILRSSRPLGVFTHWFDGRTHPCLGEAPDCIGCGQRTPKRWKCYVMGYLDGTRRPVLFEIPADAYRASVQLSDPGVSLRGARIRLERQGPNANSPVRVVLGLDVCPHGLPDGEPDVLRHLCRIWGCAHPHDEVIKTEGGSADA